MFTDHVTEIYLNIHRASESASTSQRLKQTAKIPFWAVDVCFSTRSIDLQWRNACSDKPRHCVRNAKSTEPENFIIMLKKKKVSQDNSSHLTKGVVRPTLKALHDITSFILVSLRSPWSAPCALLDWNTPPARSGPCSHFFSAKFWLKHIHKNLHMAQQWNSSHKC